MSPRFQLNDAVFDALGSPVRRRIIELLNQAEQSVSDLAEQLPVSRPAVSRHLRLLSEVGLVVHRESGAQNLYRLEAGGFAAARGWLDGFWSDALIRFKLTAENTGGKRRRRRG